MEDSIKVQVEKLAEYEGIRAEVITHNTWGAPSNLLAMVFDSKKRVLSGLTGLHKVSAVCNCHMPFEVWPYMKENGLDWPEYLQESIGIVKNNYSLDDEDITSLLTGVNMEEISWVEECYEGVWVRAWVTAGCKMNAMRIGMDCGESMERNGKFSKVGTINIIITTNANLTDGAMASSFITATEAKTVALQDFDVRSSYNKEWQATGTGTDQIVIVSGEGDSCEYVGGHTKLGEMMAKAVTKATKESISKQEKRFPGYFDR